MNAISTAMSGIRSPFNEYGFACGQVCKQWIYARAEAYNLALKATGVKDPEFKAKRRHKKFKQRYIKNFSPLLSCVPLKVIPAYDFFPDLCAWSHDLDSGDIFLDYASLLYLGKFLSINNHVKQVMAIKQAVQFIDKHYTPENYKPLVGVYIGCLDPNNKEGKPFILDVFRSLMSVLCFYSNSSLDAGSVGANVPIWSYIFMTRFALSRHYYKGHAPEWHKAAEHIIYSNLSQQNKVLCKAELDHNHFILTLDQYGLERDDIRGLLRYVGADYHFNLALFRCACGAEVGVMASQIAVATNCKSRKHSHFLNFFKRLDKATKHYFNDSPRKAWLELRQRYGDAQIDRIGDKATKVPKLKPTAAGVPLADLKRSDYIWCALDENPQDVYKRIYPNGPLVTT